jgi:hypothetical protein
MASILSRVVQVAHLLLFVPRVPPPGPCGTAVALPAVLACSGSQSDARSLGTLRRFESTVMPELVSRGVPELVHGGSDDLLLWPASLVEQQHAADWIATGDPKIAATMYLLCGSEDRAAAICEQAYIAGRARLADELIARAFGVTVDEVRAR